MYWTFDPFVARNAYLNLTVLGARVDEFVPDMYGTATNSPVHGSLGTDRFVALWPVRDEPVPLPADPALAAHTRVVASRDGVARELPDAPAVGVRIPGDYAALLLGDLGVARTWRAAARAAFQHYLARGYHVSAFVSGQGGDATYILARP
jgi:predicted GNAT superfamily acetyltransferase